ncbi:MAG: HP0495 family protein [Thermodesulfobacteriota bacterium]
MTDRPAEKKTGINYPCQWQYKLIGRESESLKDAVKKIVKGAPHSLTPSRTSRNGKYVSYNLELFVATEEIRDYYFNELRSHSAIKIIL